jgi:hypothetical protein
VLNPTGIPISTVAGTDETFPTVAWNQRNNRYLVVWQDRRNGMNFDIMGARVSNTGVVLDAAGILVSDGAGVGGDQLRPDLASNGTSDTATWVVAWTDRRCGTLNCDNIFTRRVGNNGVAGTNEQSLTSAANRQEHVRVQFRPAVPPATAGQFVAVWSDTRNGLTNSQVFARVLAADGTPLPPSAGVAIANSALSELRPALAFAGNDIFFVWRQSAVAGGEDIDLWGRRFSLTPPTPPGPGANVLAAIEPAAFVVSNNPFNEDEPSVAAANATNTMVVYQRFVQAPGLNSIRANVRRVLFP